MKKVFKYWCILTLISMLPFLVACGGSGDSGNNPIAPTSTFLGNISGKLAGEGDLSGVQVSLVQAEAKVTPTVSMRAAAVNSNIRTSLTDANGAFIFSQVPEGSYNLVASKGITQGGIYQNISVSAQSAQPTDLILRLTATGNISGTVTVPADFAASGITAYIPGTSFGAYTDQNGKYTITGIPVGAYTVAFSGTGILQATQTGINITSGATTDVSSVSLVKDPSFNAGIIWKGTLDTVPANPVENWAYLNSVDNKAYIYTNGSWQIMVEGHENSKPVISNVVFHHGIPVVDGVGNLRAGMIAPAPYVPVVTIYWQTNENTVSRIDYGTTTAYGKSLIIDNTYSIYHSAKITDLTSGTIHYRITATDGSGNQTVSEDMTGVIRTWASMNTTVDSNIYCSFKDSLGNLYIGGNFSTVGAVSASHIAKYNGAAWTALGDGLNGDVNCIAEDASGNIYVGGSFTTAGGSAAKRIAKWNPNTGTWSPLGDGMDNSVICMAVKPNGEVFAGGYFSTAGEVSANRVAGWNPVTSTWYALGEGPNDSPDCMALDSTGKLYMGGSFTSVDSTAANFIASWNGSTWSSLGLGLDARVYDIAIDSNNTVYAGGDFQGPIGSMLEKENRICGVAKWQNGKWERLAGSSVNSTTNASIRAGDVAIQSGALIGSIRTLAIDSNNNLYASGYLPGGNQLAKWNGNSWTVTNNFSSSIRDLTILGDKILAFGSFWSVDGAIVEKMAGSSL